MGTAGAVIGFIFGSIVALFGLMFLYESLVMPGLSSWFAFFAAAFIFLISAVIFYFANRARPKSKYPKYGKYAE